MFLELAKAMPEYEWITLMEGAEQSYDDVAKICQLEYKILPKK